MSDIPDNIRQELRTLIEEGLSVDQIAFMMRLSPETVQEEMAAVNTTKSVASK